MRRILQLSVLCLAAGALNACSPEEVIITENIPTAGIRFMNVVPDTIGFDFRPVDIVENTHFYNVSFRSTTLLYYKNARAGTRHFRIFLNSTNPAIASTVVRDTTVTLEAGKNYTFLLWGFARPGSSPAMKLTVMEDAAPDPGNQIALRTVHAGAGLGPLDVRQYLNGQAVPGSATWSSVAELSATNYLTTATGTIRFNVRNAGTATNVIATDPTAIAGSAATIDLDAIPGTNVAGSAVTAYIVPRSVAGSSATNLTTPTIIFLWDRRPPRPAGV